MAGDFLLADKCRNYENKVIEIFTVNIRKLITCRLFLGNFPNNF